MKYAELDVYGCPSLFLWQGENPERMKPSSVRLPHYGSPPRSARWLTRRRPGGGFNLAENVHISVSVLLCQKEKRRGDKETAAAVGGVKGSRRSSGASKQNRDMTQIPSCNGDRGSKRWEGSLDAPSGHMKRPPPVDSRQLTRCYIHDGRPLTSSQGLMTDL